MKSLRGDLMKWLLGALSLGSLMLVLVAYVFTLDEMNEVLDQNLREVAAAVAQYHAGASTTRATDMPKLPGDRNTDDADLLTSVWGTDGTLLFASNPHFKLPFTAITGPGRFKSEGEEWRSYTIVLSDAVVQAAQRTTARHQMAVESASKLFIPLAGLVALLGVLLMVALRRGLRPLDAAAAEIARRSAGTLEPIDGADVPREMQPLVSAFNDLMQKLSSAFAMQRRFVADAAHELRSPIAALRLQLKLLEHAPDEAARSLATAELQLGIDRSQRLVEQLLQLSRAQPDVDVHANEPVRLDALVRSVVADFHPEAVERDIDLGASAEVAVEAQGDALQLRSLLENLVRNALRYCPAGSRVDVMAEPGGGGRGVLRVVDNGPGLDDAEIEMVFERFRRGAGAHVRQGDPAGSGLGLAIVRAIAQRHGATVALHRGSGGQGLEVRVAFR